MATPSWMRSNRRASLVRPGSYCPPERVKDWEVVVLVRFTVQAEKRHYRSRFAVIASCGVRLRGVRAVITVASCSVPIYFHKEEVFQLLNSYPEFWQPQRMA
jgi:hypothetical protein